MNSNRALPTLHSVVAHLPFVLWGTSFVFDLLSTRRGPALVEAAFFNLAAGVAAALLAMASGVFDYLTRLGAAPAARKVARWHAAADVAAFALFVASLSLRWHARGAAVTPRPPFVLSALGVALMALGSYLGGHSDYERERASR